MGVFHVFWIVEMISNGTTHHICWINAEFVFNNKNLYYLHSKILLAMVVQETSTPRVKSGKEVFNQLKT